MIESPIEPKYAPSGSPVTLSNFSCTGSSGSMLMK